MSSDHDEDSCTGQTTWCVLSIPHQLPVLSSKARSSQPCVIDELATRTNTRMHMTTVGLCKICGCRQTFGSGLPATARFASWSCECVRSSIAASKRRILCSSSDVQAVKRLTTALHPVRGRIGPSTNRVCVIALRNRRSLILTSHCRLPRTCRIHAD